MPRAIAGAGMGGGKSPFLGWRRWDGRESFFQPLYIREFYRAYPCEKPEFPYLSNKSWPEHSDWLLWVENALHQIEQKQFEKVVLARCLEIESSSPIDPFHLCSSAIALGRYTFLLQVTPDVAFVGSSPECLYRRQGRHIFCDALAGTRPFEDRLELLESNKDLRECTIVKEQILEAITPLCRGKPTASAFSLKNSDRLCHLRSQISGELLDHVEDNDILNALHPTPAVGGHPRKAALDYLASSEPFSRGLYASPIGYKTEKSAEFAVGIRSCLIRKEKAYLFAGAGIVEGSDPQKEWEETEQKLGFWKSCFRPPRTVYEDVLSR